jgi:hypothetical protein
MTVNICFTKLVFVMSWLSASVFCFVGWFLRNFNLAWWCTSAVLALESQRQKDCELQVSVGYIWRHCVKKPERVKKKKKRKKKEHRKGWKNCSTIVIECNVPTELTF